MEKQHGSRYVVDSPNPVKPRGSDVELYASGGETLGDAGRSLTWKVTKTVFLVVVYICLGLCLEITGPTLLDLKLRTNSNFESVSTGVSGRSAGCFLGAAVGGVLVDRLGVAYDVLLAVSLDMMAAGAVALPWMPSTWLIFVVTFIQGMMEGVINIAGQQLILTTWLEKAAAPLHVLHGGFGIGSFVIPLIANPFLAVTEKRHRNISVYENTSVTPPDVITTSSDADDENDTVIKESRIEYAYIIVAVIAICVSFVFYSYHFVGGNGTRRTLLKGEDKAEAKTLSFREMVNPATCAGGRFWYGLQIFTLLFLYFIQAVGGERVGGKFIRAYSIKHLNFPEDDGSYINTAFWVAFAVGRVLGLVTARFIPIRLLIMLESGGCLITSILLVIFGGESSTALWVLIPVMGFFIGPLFPTGAGWANFHVEMTGVGITAFVFGGSIGGLIYMKLTGYLFDHYGYASFLYLLLGFGIAIFVLSTLMNIVGAQHGSRFVQDQSEANDHTTGVTRKRPSGISVISTV